MRWFLGTVFLTMALLFGVLFTPVGNALIKPFVEAKIHDYIPIEARLETFYLDWSNVHAILTVADAGHIELQGTYSLRTQHVNMSYRIDMDELSVLNTVTSRPLQGPLHVQGTIVGAIPEMVVQGRAILRKSYVDYTVNLQELDPKTVIAKGDLKLQELLYLLVQPDIADADIALHANIAMLDLVAPERSKGNLVVAVREGMINTKTVQQHYGVALEQTPFVVDINATLQDTNTSIVMDATIEKNSKVSCNTILHLDTLRIEGTYDIALKELAPFSVLAGMALQGPLYTKGTIKGNKKQTTVEGDIGIVATQMQYSLFLENFEARRLKLNGDVALHELLHLTAQPLYARADMNLLVAMNNLDKDALMGVVKTTVNSGTLNSVLLQRDFNLTLPLTTFKAEATTQIKQSVAISSLALISTFASLQTRQSVVNLINGALHSDYRLVVDDLSHLQFLTKRPLRGAVTLEGALNYEAKHLDVTAHSALLGGQMDATLSNNKLAVMTKDLQTTALSDMLMMPKVLASTMNATLNYDTFSHRGTLKATLLQGRILPSKMSMLLHQMAHFDITKEIYEATEINSSIENLQVLTDLEMRSRLSHITSKGALLDLRHNRVDARLDLMFKHYPIPIVIQGNMEAPHIGIDVKRMLQHGGKETLKHAIDTQLGDSVSPEAKTLLKELLN